MVRIAVAGAAGRMGGRIIHTIAANDRAELAGAFDAPANPKVGQSIAEVVGLAGAEGVIGDDVGQALSGADVLVEFTAPEATLNNLAKAAGAGKAMVIGTTGLDAAQQEEIKKWAAKIPVVYAPNMSVGMNLMFKLAGMIALVLGEGYALELVEAHHDQKKDAPSGTALMLGEAAAEGRGVSLDEVADRGRDGITGARERGHIGFSAIRGGDIVGEHDVIFAADGERIVLRHIATDRRIFARGALRAALWGQNMHPGEYDMVDVLGL